MKKKKLPMCRWISSVRMPRARVLTPWSALMYSECARYALCRGGPNALKIRDLLRLKQGSVIELERNAGEPLDLLVNNTVVAQGEVVLVNDRYCVRLTRILPSEYRVENL